MATERQGPRARTVRVEIGVGNCALTAPGLEYYKDAQSDEFVPAMNVTSAVHVGTSSS